MLLVFLVLHEASLLPSEEVEVTGSAREFFNAIGDLAEGIHKAIDGDLEVRDSTETSAGFAYEQTQQRGKGKGTLAVGAEHSTSSKN